MQENHDGGSAAFFGHVGVAIALGFASNHIHPF